MSTLQTRYTELQSAGRVPRYGYKLAIVDDPSKADRVLLPLGYQPSTGRDLYGLDLDGRNHGLSFDADAARAACACAYPALARKIAWKRSPSGLGWHGRFETCQQQPTGKLYAGGAHVGALIGGHTDDPGDLVIQTLPPQRTNGSATTWGVMGLRRRSPAGSTTAKRQRLSPRPQARPSWAVSSACGG